VAKKVTRKKAAKKKAAPPGAKKATAKKAVKKTKATGKKVAKKAPAARRAKATKKATKKVAAKKASAVKNSPLASQTKRLKKSPLTKTQLKQFRELLLNKRRDLIGDMNGIEAEAFRSGRGGTGGDLSNMPTHPADIGTDNYEHEFSLGLLESERSLLGEIEQALERVEKCTFGICLGTGQPIGLPRLKARPWAKYSIEYARMLEKGLVRPPDENGLDDVDSDAFDEDKIGDDVLDDEV